MEEFKKLQQETELKTSTVQYCSTHLNPIIFNALTHPEKWYLMYMDLTKRQEQRTLRARLFRNSILS